MSSRRWRFVVRSLLAALVTFGSTFDHVSWMVDAPSGAPAAYGWVCLEQVDHRATNWPHDLTIRGERFAAHGASIQACTVEWDEKSVPALAPEPMRLAAFKKGSAGVPTERHWQNHSAGRTRTPS